MGFLQKSAQDIILELLQQADIQLNGAQPWDLQIHDPEFYQRVIRNGSLGLGESYVDKWWDTPSLDQFFTHVLTAKLYQKFLLNWKVILNYLLNKLFNQQSTKKAFAIGEKHYDHGNGLYEAMLGNSLAYTCGYWKNANDLDMAQYAKFELTCQKLHLKPDMKILDIGCGFGTFLKYAAEKYGVRGVGITVSREQIKLANRICSELPIEIRLQDYRKLDEKFDRVVSLGMFEHVGYKNYLTYMQVVHRCLADNGIFLLHTIGNNESVTTTDPWINKYIFPNSMLPSIKQIGASIENLFVLEDCHNFGVDYDKTLMAWFDNFDKNWHHLQHCYPENFYRLWKYYLLSCAAAFRTRHLQLWQFVLSKGLLNGYMAIR